MRVLHIEPDPNTASAVHHMLEKAGMKVYTTDSGAEGKDLAMIYDYDLILLELTLPDMCGHELLKKLRVKGNTTPVLILSNLEDVASKLKAFGLGADDYMTKPFHREELVSRILAIVRRSRGHAQSIIKTGSISLNLDKQEVTVEGKTVHLTGREYQIMELLSMRKGTTVTKDMFLNHLYGGMDEPDIKIIDVFMVKLRRKLVEAGAADHGLETVWGRGYALNDPDDQN